MRRFLRGLVVGALAALGAFSLGANNTVTAAAFAIPLIAALIDVLAETVFAVALLFAVGSLLWSQTPIGRELLDFVQGRMRAERKSDQGELPQPPIEVLQAVLSQR